jgi:transcriptional regulator with XRE-family HTH domain
MRGCGVVDRRYRLASARKAAGFSQEGLAESVGVERSTVMRWERGETTPQPWARPKLARALGISDQALADLLGESDAPLDGRSDQAEEDVTKRRKAIGFAGKVLTAALWPDLLETVGRSCGGGHRGRIDTTIVSAHQEISQALAGLYRNGDPRPSLGIITAYSDELLDLLDAPMSDTDRIALNTVVVGVHAQAGLWACHMNRPSVAYRYLATSREVAAATGDPSLHARALGALSYLFSSAPRGGRGGNPQHCLNLLNGAISLARQADPFTRGWLFTWRADQHATLGNLAAAQADVAVADAELCATDDGQLEGFFARSTYGYGMEGHLDSVRAVVFALAGDERQSFRLFDQVQASAANMRRRIATYGHQALAQVDNCDPEAACATLSSSIQLAAREHYAMGIERAIGVRHRFEGDWSNLLAVRCLDDEFRSLSIL